VKIGIVGTGNVDDPEAKETVLELARASGEK